MRASSSATKALWRWITYMRTDSVHVSNDALAQVRELIPNALVRTISRKNPTSTNRKRTRRSHEAVRPPDVMPAPEDVRKYLDADLFKLYQLIWQRFVASQMLPAIFDQTTSTINAGDSRSVPRFGPEIRRLPPRLSIARGRTPTAMTTRRMTKERAGRLPQVVEGQVLRLDKIRPDQHFTEPPPRFTMPPWSRVEDTASGGPRLMLDHFDDR